MCLNTGGSAGPESLSDGAEAVQHPFQQGQVGTVSDVGWPVDDDQVLLGHVTDQDADEAQGKVEVGGHLGDGQDVVAEGGDGPLLHGQLRRLLPDRGGRDQRLRPRSWVGRVRPPVMA
jgi:hypothetical protein